MRRVNFRSFVYSFIMLALAIVCTLVAMNIAWLGFILLLIVIFVPPVTAAFFIKKVKTYKIVTVFITSLLCFASVFSLFITLHGWTEKESGVYIISGYIEENFVCDYERRVILKDVTLNGTEVKGRMQVTVNDKEKFFELVPIGEKMKFYAYVNVRKLQDEFTVRADFLRSDIRYVTSVNASTVTLSEGKLGGWDKFMNRIKDVLRTSMGNEYGVIAYGMLTGDKNEILSSAKDAFATAGIAHILAVSGLHIGFLTGVILFIMRKLKAKRGLCYIVIAATLALYCVIADFSPSVIRASVMLLVGYGALVLGRQGDGFNALGLAATVILVASPAMLFETGFVMSVSAVFGLLSLEPAITNAFKKIKCPEKVARIVSVPVSAQVGILPAEMYFFGTIQTYAIPVNIIVMPLIAIAFISTFIFLIISLVFPSMMFLLTLSGFLFSALNYISNFVMTLPYSAISVARSVLPLIIYPLLFVMGGYFGCKRKWIVVSISLFLILAIVAISALL